MKISFKKIIKYFFVVAFIVAGLLYANGVIYHLWLVGGPPTQDLDAHKKIAFWYSLAASIFFILAIVVNKIKLREHK